MEFSQRKTAREYYGDPLLSNLLNAVFKKYRGQNGVRGNAVIKVTSASEAKRMEAYFANRIEVLIRPGTELKVPLKYFNEELLNTGYGLTIPDLYEVLYNEPLLTKAEEKDLKAIRWADLFQEVNLRFREKIGASIDNQEFCYRSFGWYNRLKEGKAPGYRSLNHIFNKGGDVASILFHCMKALWALLIEQEAFLKQLMGDQNSGCIEIPIFAEAITNNPHGFDRSEPAGILLLHALEDIYNQRLKLDEEKGRGELVIPDFMKRRQVFRSFGLWDDDISSFVHLFAPPFIENCAPRTLNLREVTEHKEIPHYSNLYIFENPSLFSFLVREILYYLDINHLSLEQITDIFPALVCTSGRARNAALLFIDQCLTVNSTCIVYYSGDLDLPGVQMLRDMQKQFPEKVKVLKMDIESYEKKIDGDNLSLSIGDRKLIGKMPDDLEKIMSKHGKKVYQERFSRELKEVLIQMIKDKIGK